MVACSNCASEFMSIEISILLTTFGHGDGLWYIELSMLFCDHDDLCQAKGTSTVLSVMPWPRVGLRHKDSCTRCLSMSLVLEHRIALTKSVVYI